MRAFYNHTGMELKRRGITWARLDHGGKDLGPASAAAPARATTWTSCGSSNAPATC